MYVVGAHWFEFRKRDSNQCANDDEAAILRRLAAKQLRRTKLGSGYFIFLGRFYAGAFTMMPMDVQGKPASAVFI